MTGAALPITQISTFMETTEMTVGSETAIEASQGALASNALELTARIAAAYLSNNFAAISDLPGIIQSVHRALVDAEAPVPVPVAQTLVPAVSIRKSITPDYIVCLEDGKQVKMLKRHLRSAYNLTPDQYRARWGLPPDYPMVAPNYAAERSMHAKAMGLGRQAAQAVDETALAKRRGPGRPKKSA